ncbi:MAG: HEAT repeat domain-containing protein [Acidobacteria bacterium]|nr:HEAT repeat domain-containing protein [Acidobacteriota bacterium]
MIKDAFSQILGLALALGLGAGANAQELMPDHDASRRERLDYNGGRFRTGDGFRVEAAAEPGLFGSVVNMTFDAEGRALLALEGDGLAVLEDADGDGVFDRRIDIAPQVETAHGLYVMGPGDLLVHANGDGRLAEAAGVEGEVRSNGSVEDTGLYRLRDTDGDDRVDAVERIARATGRIQEHGPHTIARGPDGALYLLYGNYSEPDVRLAPSSALRDLEEDQLLPRILDPRGHANSLRAPGGTLYRLDLAANVWERLSGGLRNPFDLAIGAAGEVFAYEADMEWDRGLPWFRPTRVVHLIPAGDYGWRTGSGKFAFYEIDTLPGVVDIGRGSPVGVVFYYHDAYPERYRGGYFMGDWSRGRIRVLFPERSGATWTGEAHDFVLGEPLNVTDLDVGPDGWLYFATGGRGTSGGLYRVTYDQPGQPPEATGALRAVRQPMPRSGWGREAILRARAEVGDAWTSELWRIVRDPASEALDRQRALELLQVHGPKPTLDQTSALLSSDEPMVRAAAASLLGSYTLPQVQEPLRGALADPDPLVARRAAESLARSGLHPRVRGLEAATSEALYDLLDHEDRFLRYAAREAILRVPHGYWFDQAFMASPQQRPRGFFEALLATIYRQEHKLEYNFLTGKLTQAVRADLDAEGELDFLRMLELFFIRDEDPDAPGRADARSGLGPALLARYPHADDRVNRQLERLLAFLQPDGALAKMAGRLDEERPPEEQIHTAYCIRAMDRGWTPELRDRVVSWFDDARGFRGAASMAGYIDAIWQGVLAHFPAEERTAAEERLDRQRSERARRAAELITDVDGDRPGRSDLAQMSFEELAEYLEYDVMAYERYSPEQGERVFHRARCSACHVFGDIGRGGGPDLSTVVRRFRRREILESIMYPSRVISDQYQAVDVELDDGSFHSGMVVEDGETGLTLIDAGGNRLDLDRSSIRSREPSALSIMPEGLLDAMTLSDLASLMRFLDQPAEGEP